MHSLDVSVSQMLPVFCSHSLTRFLALPNCMYASPVARPEVSAMLRKLYYNSSSLPQAFSPPRFQICTLVTVRGVKKIVKRSVRRAA